MPKQNKFITEIEREGVDVNEVINEFFETIDAEVQGNNTRKTGFTYKNQTWFLDYHPFAHSDDIIIEKSIAPKYDNYLLIKSGGNRVRITGWIDQKSLMAIKPRDIYRNGSEHYVVIDTNVKDLSIFEIPDERKLKEEFTINKQTADNIGHKEMINGPIAGIHNFAKQSNIFFKDINQKDEFILGDKKIKLYVRGVDADEDILIYDNYYKSHPEIDMFICCKIRRGEYWYVGYVEKDVVENTRIVQMIGQDSEGASGDIRRIFAEQYKPMSDLIEIYEEETEQEIIIPQDYVPLHVHTEFSTGDAYGTVDYLAESLRKKGFKGCAITDHGTMGGTWKFQKALLEKGVKPIIGCEIYVKVPETEKRLHLILLAKNEKGWLNLLKLQNMAVREHFYYKPLVPIEEIFKNSEGLVATGACVVGVLHHFLQENDEAKAEEYLNKFKESFGDDYYGEIQIHEAMDEHQGLMKKVSAFYKKHNVKCIFTTDSHYPYKEDIKFHNAIRAIGFKKKYGEANYTDDCFYLMEDKEIIERFEEHQGICWLKDDIEELKKNTLEIYDKCNFLISPPDKTNTLPYFFDFNLELDVSESQNYFDDVKNFKGVEELKIEFNKEDLYLIHLAFEGLKKIGKADDKDYVARLQLELVRIINKRYSNYFLITWDMIHFCTTSGILVGPGRGSVGASLTAYCMGITKVDPLEFNLLFDRFISEIRRDFVDIDLDFQDTRRQEVFTYLKEKYGIENSAKVSTYSRFHPKGILRDIGRIFSIPIAEIEKVASLVLERSGGDARASFGLVDTFAEFEEAKLFKARYPMESEIAEKLEGHIRHKGVHAAALVISDKLLHTYAPIGKLNGEIVIEWEKQLVEDMKLIKYDILGLRTLSVLSDCIKDTGVDLPTDLNDKKVYEEIFSQGKTLGVFQFETVGLSKLVKVLKADNFKTLYHATTLFRPSALHSGQTSIYTNRQLGKEEIKYEHPLLEPITKETLGTIMFQEQIMQIMNQVGGMSWATAEMARKVITKSKGKKAFEEMRAEFVRNAHSIHAMETAEAEKLYDVVSTFGSYGFNQAHAVEYSAISFWCAYYKTYHPLAFYKAILKYETDDAQISNYLADAKSRGVEVVYPSINKSKEHYSIQDEKIYAGFDSIKGIGQKSSEKIIKNQPYASFEDFVKRGSSSKNIMKGLIISGAFSEFSINKKVCYNAELIKKVGDYYNGAEFTEIEYAQKILEHTTLKPEMDIISMFNFGDFDFTDISDLGEDFGGELCCFRGIVTAIINKDKLIRGDIKSHAHNFENHMIYLNLNDGTGNLAIQINPWTYTKYKDIIHSLDKKPLIVYGQLAKSGQKLYCELLELPGKTNDITQFYKIKHLHNAVIASSAGHSKAGNSYYRIIFGNGDKGMIFKAPEPIYPGMILDHEITQPPFINLRRIIK